MNFKKGGHYARPFYLQGGMKINNYTTKNNNGLKIILDLLKFLVIAFISGMITMIFIMTWQSNNPKQSDYHYAGWSSMVLELPPRTRDWKEWKGKTYCLLDDYEWHECDPRPVNSALREGK